MLESPFHALAQDVPSPFVETALSTYQTLPPVGTGTVGVAVGGIIVLTVVAVGGILVAVGGMLVATFVGTVVADGPTVGTMMLPPVIITS